MTSKFWIMIGLTVGSLLGSYLPTMFGTSSFSGAAIVGSFIGGIFGIWAGYKFSESL